MCCKWRNAQAESVVDICKNDITNSRHFDPVVQGEIPTLNTWLACWDVRAPHWKSFFVTWDASRAFMLATNLMQTKHASMWHHLATRITSHYRNLELLVWHHLCFKV